MECNGVCGDETVSTFKLHCPGDEKNLRKKLLIGTDGSVNRKYDTICNPTVHNATIAYNNDWSNFEVDENNSMVEYPLE